MNLPQPQIPFGPDDYLAWEQDQPGRNEYVDGEVFAMSGASDAHATVAGNVFARLHGLLRGPSPNWDLDTRGEAIAQVGGPNNCIA